MNDTKSETVLIHPELKEWQDPRDLEAAILECDPKAISATVIDKGHVQIVYENLEENRRYNERLYR